MANDFPTTTAGWRGITADVSSKLYENIDALVANNPGLPANFKSSMQLHHALPVQAAFESDLIKTLYAGNVFG